MNAQTQDTAGCIKVLCRLAYAHGLWIKQRIANDPKSPERYSVSGIFERRSESHLLVEHTIRDVANRKWAARGPSMLKMLASQDRICLHNGDNKPSNQKGFAGNLYIAASNDEKPRAYHKFKDPQTGKAKLLVENDGTIFSGCWVLLSVQIWAQDNKWGKRINATLRGAQYVQDDESFGAGAAPASADEFDAEDGGDLADTGEDWGGDDALIGAEETVYTPPARIVTPFRGRPGGGSNLI